MTTRLPPLYVDEVVGVANVMQPFTITDDLKKKRPIAGSQCVKGNPICWFRQIQFNSSYSIYFIKFNSSYSMQIIQCKSSNSIHPIQFN